MIEHNNYNKKIFFIEGITWFIYIFHFKFFNSFFYK